MNKILNLSLGAGLLVLMSGCSGTAGSCLSNPFKYRPLRSLFRGDECSTCNPPAGQPEFTDANVAPLCTSCGSGHGAQPTATGTDIGTPFYGDPSLNAPEFSTPQIQSARPTYPGSESPSQINGNDIIKAASDTDNVPPPDF